MIIDVAISSCARPDVMQEAIDSFFKNIITSHKLRLILLEDYVEDEYRRKKGMEWIDKNKKLFYKVYYAKKSLTNVYAMSELMKYIKTPIFFRQEDDVIYLRKIKIDPLIDLMINNQDKIAQIAWKRSVSNVIKVYGGEQVYIDNIPLVAYKMFSSMTSLCNRDWFLKIMKKAKNKWSPCQKTSNPAMLKLRGENYSLSYCLGKITDIPHAMHLGKQMGYQKGKWKE